MEVGQIGQQSQAEYGAKAEVFVSARTPAMKLPPR